MKKTRHHIIPKSKGGSSSRTNIVKIPNQQHQHYHALFKNKEPEEVLEHLYQTFFKKRICYFKNFVARKEGYE